MRFDLVNIMKAELEVDTIQVSRRMVAVTVAHSWYM